MKCRMSILAIAMLAVNLSPTWDELQTEGLKMGV